MTLAIDTDGSKRWNRRQESLDVLPSSSPLDHLKKVWQGFCDPRKSVPPDDDDEDDVKPSPESNQQEQSRSIETKQAPDVSPAAPIPAAPVPLVAKDETKESVTATEQVEVVADRVSDIIKVEELHILPPSFNPSSNESVEIEEKSVSPSKRRQTIPAHRLSYIVATAVFTLGLVVVTLLAIGHMGYKFEIEFRSKSTGDKFPTLIITKADHESFSVQTIPQTVQKENEVFDRSVSSPDLASASHEGCDNSSSQAAQSDKILEETKVSSSRVREGYTETPTCDATLLDNFNTRHSFCLANESGKVADML